MFWGNIMIQKKKLIILSLVGVIAISGTIIANAYFNKDYSENIAKDYDGTYCWK